MGGAVFATDGASWSHKSSVFYWLVDTLADKVNDPDVAERLRTISGNNLGSLRLDRFTPVQQDELIALIALIARLPEFARAELPDTDGREPIAKSMADLAHLVESARLSVPEPGAE